MRKFPSVLKVPTQSVEGWPKAWVVYECQIALSAGIKPARPLAQ